MWSGNLLTVCVVRELIDCVWSGNLLTVCGQGKLEKLEEQFERIEQDRLQYPQPGMVCIALVKTDMEDGSSEDVYLRARVQEVKENEVSVLQLINFRFVKKCVLSCNFMLFFSTRYSS